MTTFKLDGNNNISFNNGIFILDGNDAIAQDVKTRLMMFATENPFNTDEGLNYYDLALQNSSAIIQDAIISRVLEDSRIDSVTSISSYRSGKELTFSLELLLANGDTINV